MNVKGCTQGLARELIRLFCIVLAFNFADIPMVYTQKHDYHWLNGPSLSQDKNFVMYEMKFDDDERLEIDSFPFSDYIYMRNGQIAISDFDGNLIFYTNGNYLVNSKHKIIEGGGELNYDSPFRNTSFIKAEYCVSCYYIIPNSYTHDIFYLVHPLIDVSNEINFNVTSSKLQLTRVDVSLGIDNEIVTFSDSIIYNGWSSGRFSLVKHGNGKDWWIIMRSENGSQYILILLGNDMVITRKSIFNIDPEPYLNNSTDSLLTSQGSFVVSPSGDLILERLGDEYARLLYFDRCIGEFDYVNEIQLPIDTYYTPPGHPRSEKLISGVGQFTISSNNQMAYAWSVNGLYQWDLNAEDISESRLKIFGPPVVLDQDQIEDPYSVVFPYSAYGPDGKIYYLFRRNHYIIHRPDERGVAAEVEGPRALGQNIYFDSPNYPNYRLGPVRGSICDTLLSSEVNYGKGGEFTLYPNPTEGQVTVELDLISWDRDDVTLSVYDALGRQLYRHVYNRWSYIHEIEAGTLPPGVYFVRLELGTVPVQTQRLVVSR